jgi:hypothetical protein
MNISQTENKTFTSKSIFLFKTITILFVICLISIAVLSYMKEDIKVESRFPIFNRLFENMKFDIDFPLWLNMFVWFFEIAVFAIPIYLLISSFGSDMYFRSFLSSKKAVFIFYILLSLFSIIIIFVAYTDVTNYFFKSKNSNVVLDRVVDFLYPVTISEKKLNLYNKISAVLFSILAVCNIYILFTFIKSISFK